MHGLYLVLHNPVLMEPDSHTKAKVIDWLHASNPQYALQYAESRIPVYRQEHGPGRITVALEYPSAKMIHVVDAPVNQGAGVDVR